jgi:hypothetical protein
MRDDQESMFYANLGAEFVHWQDLHRKKELQIAAHRWERMLRDHDFLPVFDRSKSLIPWLSTQEAEHIAQVNSLRYAAASAQCVALLHDKGRTVRLQNDQWTEYCVVCEIETCLQPREIQKKIDQLYATISTD